MSFMMSLNLSCYGFRTVEITFFQIIKEMSSHYNILDQETYLYHQWNMWLCCNLMVTYLYLWKSLFMIRHYNVFMMINNKNLQNVWTCLLFSLVTLMNNHPKVNLKMFLKVKSQSRTLNKIIKSIKLSHKQKLNAL